MLSAEKISDFGVDFSYLQSFFQRHACTLFYLIGKRVCDIFECCFGVVCGL